MKSKIIVTYKNGDQKIVNRIEDIEKTKKVISLEFVGEFKELYLLESESYENLSSVILPEGLEIISESAFERCYKLRNINIPSSVYKISSSAFRGCSSLEKIVIPNSVYDIEECAFRSCTSLKEVILPFGIKEINSGVFSECESLESIVIPDFVVEIGANAFSNCLSLKEIILPEYLEKICEDAFYCCKGLKKISIPKKVKKIGTLCLGECERLEKLTLYNPLNSMSSFLQGCCSLTEIEFMSSFNGKIQPLFLKKVQSVSNIIFHYDDKKQLIDNLKNMLKEEREFRIDSYYFPAHVKKISFVGEQLSFIEKFRIKDLINSFYTKRKNSISCEFISKGQSLLLEDSRMEEKELISNAEEFDEEIQDLFQRIHDISNKSSESLKLHLAQVTKELIKEYEQQKLKEEPVFELELFHQLQLTSTEIGNAKLELKVKLNNILNSLMHQERLVMLLKELEQYHNLLKEFRLHTCECLVTVCLKFRCIR